MAKASDDGNPLPFATFWTPANLPWQIPIDKWMDVNVDKFYDWILVHQRRLHAGDTRAEDTVFQFLKQGEEEVFCCDGQILEYKEDAAFYFMTIQRYQFTDNVYRPLSVHSTQCFTTEFIQSWQSILPASAVKLLELVDRQQVCNPPNVS
jgi:hypothetical protein